MKQRVKHHTIQQATAYYGLSKCLRLAYGPGKIVYYLNMFLALSFQIRQSTGNHNHHSCFYTLRTPGSGQVLSGIRQYLGERKIKTYMLQKT